MMIAKTIFALAALAVGPASALWPVPKDLTTGKETLFIDQSVKVTYNGQSVSLTASYFLVAFL